MLKKSRSLTRKEMIVLCLYHVCVVCVFVRVCVITHQWNMKIITMRKPETTSVRIHIRLYSYGVCRDTDHKWLGFFDHDIKLYYFTKMLLSQALSSIIQYHLWVALNFHLQGLKI